MDDFLPGFEPIPYRSRGVSVELLKPSPACKKLGAGDAWARDDKSVAVVCLRCFHEFSLPKRQFGTKVGLTLERERCEDVWLVSAHVGCNRAKYAVGRTMSDRLNVYLRYVWPFAGKDDLARWDDFRLYVGVLDKLLRLRLNERSDRGASARG